MIDYGKMLHATRREVITAVGSVAAFAGTSSTAVAATSEVGFDRLLPVQKKPRDFSGTQAILNTRWTDAKKKLVADPRFQWLQPFAADLTVDAIVFNGCKSLAGKDNEYDPYQGESLIASSSSILDRCLVYRREMYSLEEQAVRSALEYRLFSDQYAPQLAIELAERVETQRKLEQDGQTVAASKFSSDTASALSSGFAAISTASASSSTQAVLSEQDRKKNVRIKSDAVLAYQQALQDRHGTPGNALNYGERFDRLRVLLEQDVTTAFKKVVCVKLAINKLWGVDIPWDDPFEIGYLDRLVKYLRDVINAVEIATIEEVDFDHIVSLRQPHAKPAYQLVIDQIWNVALDPVNGNGLISFSLDTEFLPVIKRLRVRTIGLSMLIDAPGDISARLRTTSAVVFPPAVQDLFSPTNQRVRPPVVIENIGLFGAAAPKMYASPGVQNLDPRIDNWQIQISHNMIWPDGISHGRASISIHDIKIHLGLSAIFDNKKVGSWQEFNS